MKRSNTGMEGSQVAAAREFPERTWCRRLRALADKPSRSPEEDHATASFLTRRDLRISSAWAVAAGCQAIVTHNTRDFTGADRFGVEVLTPGQFLRRLEGGR